MTIKNKTALAFILGGIAGTTMLAGSFAYKGPSSQLNSNIVDTGIQEQMQAIIENHDYEAFQDFFENKGPAKIIDTEEKFEQWLEIKELFEDGNIEEAQRLSEDLGLGQRTTLEGDTGVRKKIKKCNQMYKTIQNQTFEQFQEMVAASPIAEDIDTEEKFQKFIDMHKAMEEENFKKVKSIRQELGLSVGGTKRHNSDRNSNIQNNNSERGEIMNKGGMIGRSGMSNRQ